MLVIPASLPLGQGALRHRKDEGEQPRRVEQLKRGAGRAEQQQLADLLEHPLRRRLDDEAAVGQQRGVRLGVEGEAQRGGEAHRSDHPDGILDEALVRVADGTDAAVLDVLVAADVVDDGEVVNVVEEGVEGEVAPPGVLLRRSEHVVAQDLAVLALDDAGQSRRQLCRSGVRLGRRVVGVIDGRAEGGHLHDLVAEVNVGQPEPAPHQPAVAEDLLDPGGRGIVDHVHVLGPAPQQQVADPAAHDVGRVAVAAQVRQHLEHVRADIPSGDRMLCAGDDQGIGAVHAFRLRERAASARVLRADGTARPGYATGWPEPCQWECRPQAPGEGAMGEWVN